MCSQARVTTAVDVAISPGIAAARKRVKRSPVFAVVHVVIKHVIVPRRRMCAMIVVIQVTYAKIARTRLVRDATRAVKRGTSPEIALLSDEV